MSELESIDVVHVGSPRVICCHKVDGDLVDPGPTASVHTLLEALGGDVPQRLLLTHIHLDHAGASGTLVRKWPDLEVYVHEIGAPHLADPAKLLQSAERLYGDQMERLWGEVAAVPEGNLRPLTGGERIGRFEVAYTPGHASHHVSFMHHDSGRAFVGDTAGVRIPPADHVVTPTPPPDIDLEAWRSSLATIRDWEPETLGITHFDEIEDPAAQLATVERRLAELAELARRTDAEEFERQIREEIAAATDAETAAVYLQAVPPEQQWLGLDRYWRKRAPS
jgi:glyoxylase-like metal-dependent hydrolase (beta-lactamase superfamily II)